MISAEDCCYNLPLYPRLLRASHHDSVSWIYTYRKLHHWYASWKFMRSLFSYVLMELTIYPKWARISFLKSTKDEPLLHIGRMLMICNSRITAMRREEMILDLWNPYIRKADVNALDEEAQVPSYTSEHYRSSIYSNQVCKEHMTNKGGIKWKQKYWF